MTLVDSLRRADAEGPVGAPRPAGRGPARGRGTLAAFVRIHIRGMDPRRTVLTVLSLALGGGSLMAVLLLLQAVNRPFTEVADLANSQRPPRGGGRSRGGPGPPAPRGRGVPREARPVPVVVGFADVAAGGHRQGAVLLGGDCRLRRLGLLRDCAQVRDALGVPGPGYPLVLTRKLATVLRVRPGGRVLLPGGAVAHFAGVVPADPRLERLNGGYLAIGLVPDVADLLGHPGSVTAVVLSSRSVPAQRVADAVGAGATVGSLAGRTVPPIMLRAQQLYGVFGVIAACAGVFLAVSTFLVGAVERRRNLAVVAVVGAGRRRLVGGYLAEGALVGAAAAPFACAAGALGGGVLVRVLGSQLFYGTGVVTQVSVPLRLVAFVVAVTILLGVAAAAITVYAVVSRDPVPLLGRAGPPESAGRVRSVWTVVPAVLLPLCLLLARFGAHGGMPQPLTLGVLPLAVTCGVALLLLGTPLITRLPPPMPSGRARVSRMLVGSELSQSPLRTALTITSLGLGVMLFVAIQGFRASNEKAMATGLPRLSAGSVVVYPRQVGNFLDPPLSDRFLDRLTEDPEVAALTSRVGRITATVLPSGIGISGISRGNPLLVRCFRVPHMGAAEMQAVLDQGEAIITEVAAGNLRAQRGSVVTLPTVEGNRRMRVGAVATLVAGEPSGLSATVVLGYDTVRRLWDAPLTGATLAPRKGVSLARLREALPRQAGIYYPTAREAATQAQAVMRRFLAPLVAIGWLAMFVAAFSVLDMLLLSLLARRRERAALRAIGLSAPQEATLVLGNALTLAGYGALLGVGVGLVLELVFNLSGPVTTGIAPPFVVDGGAVLAMVVSALAASLLGSLLPLAQVRTFDVAAAMRDE